MLLRAAQSQQGAEDFGGKICLSVGKLVFLGP